MTEAQTAGAICAGYRGLEKAAELALGPVETAWHAEVDPDASAVLAARYPGVPNHGDITAVDWRKVQPVSRLCAGFPCQPVSAGGKQLGDADQRWLWERPGPDLTSETVGVIAAVRVIRPATVVIENVARLVTIQRGRLFRTVLDDLRAAGYAVRWAIAGACTAGACHHRHRVFVLARRVEGYPPPAARVAMPTCAGGAPLLPTPRATDGVKGGPNMRGSSGDLMLPSAVQPQRWHQFAAAAARWADVFGTAAPEPTEPGGKTGHRLSARFAEWMMGLPAGWVTDLCSRNDALRLLGNGVMPQHGARVLRLLAADLAADEDAPTDLLGMLAAQ